MKGQRGRGGLVSGRITPYPHPSDPSSRSPPTLGNVQDLGNVTGPFVSWFIFTPTPVLTLEGEGSGGAAPGEVRAGVGMMGAASGV